ncbi:MAG: Gx transporter family protein [Actinomycetota bacterium]|nr:Gx transporter family protein [Actinomycetota bacterium]
MGSTRRVTNLALLVAVGLSLSIVESTLPPLFPIPGAKLGLANIATVITLVLFDPLMAFEVTIFRTILGGLLRGSIVGLFLSFSGGIVSTLIMVLILIAAKKYVSVIGLSIAGAAAHNITQLAAAFLFVRHASLFVYLPYMLLVSIPTGLFVGFCSTRLSSSLKAIVEEGA